MKLEAEDTQRSCGAAVKSARRLTSALRLAVQLSMPAALCCLPAVSASLLVGCADENDPQTWVKRLDDPAQKANAIKRLTQFFEDAMTKANKDRENAEVKALLDKIAEPMTKAYTGGNLDEKTRKDLIKILADTRDPRTSPALAKALKDYEPGKTDEDVRYASQAIIGMAKAKTLTDQSVIDALWDTFQHFEVSKAKSGNLVKDLHDAVVAVSHPSYGPKAQERLNVPVKLEDEDAAKNQLEFWQLTSAQVIKELAFVPAIKTLVAVLLTQNKLALNAIVRSALLKMAKEAEPVLIQALKSPDPELAKQYKDKAHLAIIADVLGLLSRPGGRDAILAAIPNADTATTRFAFAQSLVQFPADPRSAPAFRTAFDKIGKDDTTELSGLPPRAALTQVAAQFYDPSLVEWLVKESSDLKGAIRLLPLESAIKLMKPSQAKMVQDALTKAEPEIDKLDKQAVPLMKQLYKFAAQDLDKCGENADCYLKVLDETIPSSPPSANQRAVKAIYMSVIFGGGAKATKTRDELMQKLTKVMDTVARLSLVQAIDQLTPEGSAAIADELDKLVEADKKTGDKQLLAADDAVVKVASRLRSRAAK